LWDEGFHLEVIMDWDMDLALEIISSWFKLMDDNGWIAREQILGSEARSKVLSEFQTQNPHYTNPPTLFLVIQVFVAKLNAITPYAGTPSRLLGDPTAGRSMLAAVYPKLRKHYECFVAHRLAAMERFTSIPVLTSTKDTSGEAEHPSISLPVVWMTILVPSHRIRESCM